MTDDVALIARLRDGDNRMCPFEGPVNMQPIPQDACPVCGDLGDISNDPSNCVGNSQRLLRREAANRIAALTRERDKAHEDAVLAQTGEIAWQSRAEQAEAERDQAIATATIANVGLKAAVARADKAEAERDARTEALQQAMQGLENVKIERDVLREFNAEQANVIELLREAIAARREPKP